MERGPVAQIRRYGAAAALPVFLALPCFALSDPLILSRPEDVRTLVREAQAAALPSATATTQDVGMVSVSPLDARTATWFGAVGPGEAVAFEDSATADTVLTNPVSGGASRLPAEVGYDPFGIFSVAGYDFETNPDLLPFYDPGLVAVAMRLVLDHDPESGGSGMDAEDGFGTGETGGPGGDGGSTAQEDNSIEGGETEEIADCGSPYPGYAQGATASYYEFPFALSAVPDFADRIPDFVQLEENIDHPDSSSWPGIDMSARHRFAARYSFCLYAPATGEYALRLQSDDGSVLRLDGVPFLDNDGVHGRLAKTETAYLVHGFHDVEIGYFDEGYRCGLQLLWNGGAGSSFAVVPSNNVWHVIGNPDSDGDGMPDWWEALYGLDSGNPSDSLEDCDGDGLSNLEEFLCGTDPHRADTDGDGMSDAWETAHGLRPCNASDASADQDGDGLVNLAEFHAGTDPGNPDTDGDGETDGMEVLTVFSNPLVVDFDGTETVESQIDLSSAMPQSGLWIRADDSLDLADRRGTVAFRCNVSKPGVFRIRVSFRTAGSASASLSLSADGVEIGKEALSGCFPGDSGHCDFFTPHLAAGLHSIVVSVRNQAPGFSFSATGVAVSEPGGPDADGNGRPDWLDARLGRSRLCVEGAVTSMVSPYCIRGKAVFLPLVELSSRTDVHGLPANGWWSDISLDPVSPVSVTASFENGASGQSFSVSWVPFDVCTETSAVVRAGDSMLLAASASGGRDAEISVAGPATNASFAVVSGQTVPFEFRNPGEYGISASWIDQSGEYRTASAAVAAVSGSLPPCIPLWAGKYNAVHLPEVPHTGAALVLEDFFEAETFSPVQSGGWRGAASPSMEDFLSGKASGFVALQLGGSDGAVLDSAPVLPFWPLWTLDGEYRIVETLPDGTRVAETVVHCPDLPEGVELELWCYNAGFCFEDGGATLRFSREDLRENGTFACRTLLSGEVVHPCQFLRAFYNGLKTVD